MSPRSERLLGLFAEDAQVRYGSRTAPQYTAQVRVLLSWLMDRGVEVVAVRGDDLAAFQAELLTRIGRGGRTYSISAQASYVSAIRSFFRFLCRRSYLVQDPSTSLAYPRADQRLPRTTLTADETRRVLASLSGRSPRALRDRAILETLYATGIRSTELANLTPYDVDTEERTLRVVLGKGRKDRVVPLTRAAAAAIERYLVHGRPELVQKPGKRFLFVSDKGGWLHRAVLAKIVRRCVHVAGVRKPATCHTLRHTMATHLLQGRADIRHIQALLGHANLSTTERYTRVEIADLRKVVERAHPRGR